MCRYFEGFIQKANERSQPIVAGHAIAAAAFITFIARSVTAQRKTASKSRKRAA
jgi:hypothetical protein